MDKLINYFLMTLPEAYTLLVLGGVLFGYSMKKIRYKAFYGALIIAFLSDLMWNVNLFVDFRILYTFLFLFLAFRFLIEKSLRKAFVMAILANFVLLIFEIIVAVITMQFFTYEEILNNLLIKFFVIMGYTLPTFILSLVIDKKKWNVIRWYGGQVTNKKDKLYWVMIIFLAIIQILIIIYLNYSFYIFSLIYKNKELYNIHGLPISSILLVLVNIFLVFFIIKVISHNAKQEISIAESNYNHYLENLLIKLKIERHDFISEIQTINGLVQTKMYEQLGEYVSHLVGNVRDVSKITKINNITVNALLYTKIEQIESEGVTFRVDAQTSDAFESIKGYDLVKIISNLLDNALRATTEKVILNPFIELYWGKGIDSNTAIFRVSNNGPKISENDIGIIFEKGYSTKENGDNSGYGLSILKSIVHKYKGTIEVESNQSLTSFTIKIPL